ncbi:2-oxo acid dehydrogenase subunit E2 [Bacilliculturomica massiliensis]|uniref:2-oxo acid dehydrogenase subunit E2 n=1 Tax=Bacilliculturomica massiliensis TaxID=1917867 RepID=UPI0010318A45|nr:2-oxo acid dehydrogenase subunit E2 [Bacilliculturomica massiliensis]
MAEIIVMPKLGFNMSEGKLVNWYKKEGESVRKGENLFSVETDKTNMDIEATGDGVVRSLLIKEGDSIAVTLPIAIVGDSTEDISAVLAEALALLGKDSKVCDCEATGQTESTADALMTAVKSDGGRAKISPRARRKAGELGISSDDLCRFVTGTGFDGGICEKDVLAYAASLPADTRQKIGAAAAATPVARNMAAAENLDLDGIAGTGANGKVTKQDIQAAMAGAAAGGAARTCQQAEMNAGVKLSQDGKEILEEVPYAGVRKIIGDRLAQSKFTAPHLYFTQKVDLTNLLELRREVNAVQEQKTSVTDFIAKAAVKALQKYPEMNASLLGDTIVKYKTVNVGIAVAAPGGLIVPVVKNAEAKTVTEIAAVSSALFEKARAGKLTPDEYTGGTFTISNLGMFGIENFTAIINPPEMGILAVSSTKDEPAVIVKADGTKEIAIRPMMNIQLTTDHRVIDGLLAAQFVTEIKDLLERPVALMV